MDRIDGAVFWFFRMLPAVVLLSVLFTAEGAFRWVGLLGVVPLLLATQRSCPSCVFRRSTMPPGGNTLWVGH